MRQTAKFRGRFRCECVNPDGSVAWVKEIDNGITNVGLNHVLDTEFAGGSQSSTWFLGLIDNAGFSTLAAADTMVSHAGWSESVAYSESPRPTWTVGAASGQQVTNAAVVVFTATAGVTINGIFAVDNSTKNGTSGTLWATGSFDTPQALVIGQKLNVTYTTTASG